MKAAVVVSARSDSQRLPGKALLPLAGTPCIEFLLRRLKPSREASAVVFATTDRPVDNELAAFVGSLGVPVHRGPTNDLIGRYLGAAREFGLNDHLVRVTGDCPFVGADSLDYFLQRCRHAATADLYTTRGCFPVGIDYELFSVQALQRIAGLADLTAADREHLTLRLYRNGGEFRVANIDPPADWPKFNRALTLDTPEDYNFISSLAARMAGKDLTTAALLKLAEKE